MTKKLYTEYTCERCKSSVTDDDKYHNHQVWGSVTFEQNSPTLYSLSIKNADICSECLRLLCEWWKMN